MDRDSVISRAETILRSHQGINFRHDPPPTGPSVGSFSDTESLPLHADLLAAIKRQYPDGLFRHQAMAIRQVLAGENTVVATQTSSGKSRIYSIPVLQALLHDQNATALFIYPQKALANDQLEKIRTFVKELPVLSKIMAKARHFVGRYDGSTEEGDRESVRAAGSDCDHEPGHAPRVPPAISRAALVEVFRASQVCDR